MRSTNHVEKQRGQALVEFALMLPILVLLLMLIMDFSRIMFVYAQVANSAREAARFGSVIGNDADDPRYFDCDGIKAAAEDTLIFAMEITSTIKYDNGETLYDWDCDSAVEIQEGDRIRVTVETSVDFITPGVSAGFVDVLTRDRGLSMEFSSARTIWSEGIIVAAPAN